MVPENFQESNLQLIQFVKDFLQKDEAHFSELKVTQGVQMEHDLCSQVL